MTIITEDANRAMWEARARGEQDPAWESLTAEPDGIEQAPAGVPGGLWLRPPSAPAGAAVLAIHGGGFVGGSVETHRRLFGHLARAAGAATLAAEYGLVPGHVFPSQLDAVVAAYRWLLDQGATRVAVTGDSCGATLALGVALRSRDQALPLPAGRCPPGSVRRRRAPPGRRTCGRPRPGCSRSPATAPTCGWP
jgi:epsilon-lactone hydrolase